MLLLLRVLARSKYIIFLVAGGVVLLLFAVGIRWVHDETDPERAFYGMVSQSLKTSSVTIQGVQNAATGTTAHQTTQYTLGQNYVHTLTTFTQGSTTVKDEIVGTPAADYTRYVMVKTDQKSAKGKPLDFSKVIGVWSKSDNGTAGSSLVSQSVLGSGLPLGGIAMPIGNLTPRLQAKLFNQIKNDKVFTIDFSKVAKSHQNGRLIYTYHATLNPEHYAAMAKTFAQGVGIKDLDTLDPANYAGQPSFGVDFSIDVYAHHLISVTSKDAGITQTYSAYDVPVIVSIPSHTITTAELQKRLQDIQQ